MNKSEAFRKLGYDIGNPMNQWSAENEEGVCISLWQKEMVFTDGRSWIDTRLHAGPAEEWSAVGANLRAKHLKAAIEKFRGHVDVVVLYGEVGKVKNCEPWFPPKSHPNHGWIVTDFDVDTGHFVAEMAERPKT